MSLTFEIHNDLIKQCRSDYIIYAFIIYFVYMKKLIRF